MILYGCLIRIICCCLLCKGSNEISVAQMRHLSLDERMDLNSEHWASTDMEYMEKLHLLVKKTGTALELENRCRQFIRDHMAHILSISTQIPCRQTSSRFTDLQLNSKRSGSNCNLFYTRVWLTCKVTDHSLFCFHA